MKSLILCEGKTDAILLSYYMCHMYGWNPLSSKDRKKLKSLSIKADTPTQNADWYQRNNDYLLICSVGGNSNFGNFFRDKIKDALINTSAFQKIIILTDRDNHTEEEIADFFYHDFDQFFPKLVNNHWQTFKYSNAFNEAESIQLLLVIIPQNQQGALETVLLNAISENPYDKFIVDNCKSFVESMRPHASKYISTNRLQLKSWLNTTWAIQSPEKVFDFINEQINSVSWESSSTLKECFSKLSEI